MRILFKINNLKTKHHIHNYYYSIFSHNNPTIQTLIPSQSHNTNNNNPYNYNYYYNTNNLYNIQKRWHVGHSHHHDRSGKEPEKIIRLGLAADIGLAAGKSLAGYLSGSTALIADAAHSISDVVLSGVALVSFKAARIPKDKEHPYGHGKFETLGALGISFMLLGTAGGIAWHALDILMGMSSVAPDPASQVLDHAHVHNHQHGGHHHELDMSHPILALNMAIISIAVKEGLYWITKKAGEKEGSGLMIANAWHHRADAVSSLVALIGVGGSILGVKFFDPLAGIIVSGMILKAGLQTGYQSILELVDAAIPSEELDPYRKTILQVEGVKGYYHLRGRRAGSSLYLDVNIEVDPFSSVSAAHDVCENVRHEIQKSHREVAEVFIHIEPAVSMLSANTHDQPGNEKEIDWHNRNFSSELKYIEDIVSKIFSSKFSEEMVLRRITRHLLPDKILLQLEVSMPPNVLIRDANKIAKEAEREIIKEAALDNVQICIQLRLGDDCLEIVNLDKLHSPPTI